MCEINNMFVGRNKEIDLIIDRVNSSQNELIAITGKRGVGKTTLMMKVKEYFSDIPTILLTGQKSVANKIQLQRASNELKLLTNKNEKITNWMEFFKKLGDFSRQNKIILLIDEFPWLNVKGSLFVEDFSSFWNILPQCGLKVILTGSAVSWINKNIFRAKGGLYHKTTLRINLKPFDLLETRDFLIKENPNFRVNDFVEYYLLTGGVVRYLQQIKVNKNIEENRQLLYGNTFFDDFFDNSFNSTKTDIHKEIVKLFKNRIKLSIDEIKKKLKVSDQLIYSTLKELIETDILIDLPNPKEKNKKDYVLIDLYCYYHLRNQISSQQRQRIIDGYSLEILAIRNINILLDHINRSGFKYSISKWNGKKSQIDLLVNYENNSYSIIECKNYNGVYELELEETHKILNRMDEFYDSLKNKKSQIDVLLVSVFGSKTNTSLKYQDISLEKILLR